MQNSLKQKSVFIAIAPNHISNFESMIDNDLSIGNTLLFNPGGFDFNKDIWSEVINGSLDLKYNESNSFNKLRYQIKKLLGYKTFTKKIRESLTSEYNYNYYYCNLDDVLSNYIFHYLNNKANVINHAVEDGILNYYYPTINTSKLKSKRLFCKYVLGIDFIPEKNHPTRINSNSVRSQYVRIPESSICPEKSVQLPYSKIHYDPKDKVVLIIGQDIMHNSEEGPLYYKDRLKALFESVKKETIHQTKIVYKPHRNGDHSIAEEILITMFENVELFMDITPIEECITQIKPSKIYSFESSAILNLKIAFEDVKVCIAVLPYSKPQSNLLRIFNKIGIKILE